MITIERAMREASLKMRERPDHSEIPTNRVEPETFHPRRNLANILRIGGTVAGGLLGLGIFAGVLEMKYAALTFPIVISSAGLGWFVGDSIARRFSA